MREQDTPNVDPAKTPDNTRFGADTVAGALARFNERLPAKYRKDAVLEAWPGFVKNPPHLGLSR